MQNARRVPGRTRRTTTIAAALAVAVVGAVATASASGDSHRSASSPATVIGRAVSEPVKAAQATLKQLEQPVSRFEPNGKPFKAGSFARGKTIGIVAGTTVVPLFWQEFNPFRRDAAKLLGFRVKICDGKNFQAAAIIRCISLFTNQRVDAIILQSIDPKGVQGPLSRAKKAGVLVITSNTSLENAPLPPNVDAQVAFPYLRAAELEALTIVALSGGAAKTLVITSNEYVNSPPMKRVIERTFAKYCGERCKPTFRDVPIAQWNQRLTPLVQSTVQSDRDINYILPLFDGEVPMVTAGLRAANATDRVNIVSFNGSHGVVDFLAQSDHPFVGDIGTWPEHLGWATADAAVRLFAGQRNNRALRDAKIAVRIFTRKNIDGVDLKRPGTWYGQFNLQAYYKKQWMMK